jgi:hypothetical protein
LNEEVSLQKSNNVQHVVCYGNSRNSRTGKQAVKVCEQHLRDDLKIRRRQLPKGCADDFILPAVSPTSKRTVQPTNESLNIENLSEII